MFDQAIVLNQLCILYRFFDHSYIFFGTPGMSL